MIPTDQDKDLALTAAVAQGAGTLMSNLNRHVAVPDQLGSVLAMFKHLDPEKGLSDTVGFGKGRTALAAIPGVAGYTNAVRRRMQEQAAGGTGEHTASEIVGTIASTWLLAAGCSALMPHVGPAAAKKLSLLSKHVPPVASLAGTGAALVTKRRAVEEQQAHDKSSVGVWANLLIPGVAAYNNAKALQTYMGDRRTPLQAGLEKSKELLLPEEPRRDSEHDKRVRMLATGGGALLGGTASYVLASMLTRRRNIRLMAALAGAVPGAVLSYKHSKDI